MRAEPPRASPEYEPARYWGEVAERVRTRGLDPELAGNAGPFHRYLREKAVRRFLERLPVSGSSVLELGCGPGGNLRALGARGPARLVGADISLEMVDLARSNTEAEVVWLDGSGLPFADQEFDCAFTMTVLQHNSDHALPAVIAELTRVTRSTLMLIEVTAPLREHSAGGSFWVRHNERYISLVTGHGFRLRDATTLDAWVSEKAWLVIRRLMSAFDRSPHGEGASVSALEYELERFALRLTRHLDRRVPQLSGTTALAFERL